MNNFNFSHLSRFFCCHPSNFETSELFCSSLISKYISHRQNGPQLFTSDPTVDFDPTFYQSRPTGSAPYYYGDIASYQQHRQQQATNYLTNSEPTRVYAIMDGLRVQLKNPGRSAHSLRSPNVHRSDEFTVSLRGWLYRLEGAALKQWKRRWCVLADYCLFYYKDVKEEKKLGSLLLPSYRISPCFNSDGISRKFSFKAEHNNMKTYYFAADSKEMQQQWMNALSLASIMQLNIMCPSGKVNKPKTNASFASANTRLITNSQPVHRGNQRLFQPNFDANYKSVRAMNEDESGFLAYEAKRIDEGSSAIMYGANYFNANGYSGAPLNLYNSVGLPSVYSDQMLPYNNFDPAPPKPQRQYYDPMMTYDMPVPNTIDYKYNDADMMQQGPTANFLNNYDQFYSENGHSSLQYPEFIETSEFRDYPPNYFQRLPPRPHSADFLERNQDDDFDEECQNAFEKEDKSAFFTNANNLAPKILPSRPKSSIARYDPMLKAQHYGQLDAPLVSSRTSSYQSSKKEVLPNVDSIHSSHHTKPSYGGSNNLSQYFIYARNGSFNSSECSPVKDVPAKEDTELGSQILSSYCKSESVANRLAPVRPPLPHEYATKFNHSLIGDLDSDHSHSFSSVGNNNYKVIVAKSDSTGKTETSYTSDDEMNKARLSAPRSSAQQPAADGLIEISKEDYYKASQMFFQRQKYLQVVTTNNSNSDISEASVKGATNREQHTVRQSDWNDIGLPLPTVNSMSSHSFGRSKEIGRVKATKMALESIDKSSSCSSSLQSFQMNFNGDQEVKFKLSSKVRTYKKPKNGHLSSGTAASDTSSSDIVQPTSELKSQSISRSISEPEPCRTLSVNGANCRPSDLSESGSVSEEGTGNKTAAATVTAGNSAPYYYSDLLTEEQKAALQKKLGNFASPPPLLSRCTAINNARYLGMTSLNLKAKMGSISGEKQLADNGDHHGNEPNCVPLCNENEENEQNEEREKCHSEVPPDSSEPIDGQLGSELVNSESCPPPTSHLPTPSEPHIYQNYDSVSSVSPCPVNLPLESTQTNGSHLMPLERTSNQTGVCTSLDDYFGGLNSQDCLDSLHEFNSKSSRKRRVKRKSKEHLNVSDSEIHRKTDKYRKTRPFKYSRRMCFSAADYVGKSHEELILMLLQLRRRQSELSKSCEQLRIQMESEATMMEIEPHRRDEYGYRFKELKQQLSKVEKEYEFQLPIIESIDGLIKVKSSDRNHSKAASTSVLDQVTLRCGTGEEVNEEEESLALVRQQLADVQLHIADVLPIAEPESCAETPDDNIEHLKKQQIVLAGELDRVRGMLTNSTKRLEEKAVENAQMEQEMLIARNKLKQVLENEHEAMEISRSSKLEAELAHINKVIDDLHNRRHELNTAIENLKHPDTKSTESFLRSGGTSFMDPLAMVSDSIELERIETESSRYRDLMLNSSEPIPLYENITSGRGLEEEIAPGRMIFDQVNNNLDNSENDEFFTLNINLNKTKQYNNNYSQDSSSVSEINNNDSQHNLNTMCEFDPTKDIHMAYGDSIVDQQIKQIYNYQAMQSSLGQKPAEIKTVREVKRESERRKYQQQQQSYKLSHIYRNDRTVANGNGSYYMMANHFYNENQEPLGLPLSSSIVTPNGDEFDVLPAYDPSVMLTSISQGKLTHAALQGEEMSRTSYTTPDIVQSTIKYSDDFYEREP